MKYTIIYVSKLLPFEDFLVVSDLRITLHARDMGFGPGQGAEIPRL